MSYATVKTDVRAMFNSIAERYDLLNSILSLGVDKIWRKQLLAMVKGQSFESALDIATGTGAFLPALSKLATIVKGVDISPGMLAKASLMIKSRGLDNVSVVEGDALSLPLGDQSVDLITVAFGVRNFENLEAGLSEMRRVLKADGTILVLEFGQPRGVIMRALYRFYSHVIVPAVGGLISGDRAAYKYLNKDLHALPLRARFHPSS